MEFVAQVVVIEADDMNNIVTDERLEESFEVSSGERIWEKANKVIDLLINQLNVPERTEVECNVSSSIHGPIGHFYTTK